MVEMRFTMAIVFISFTYLYLDFFQDDVLAVAQYVLSKGMTTYSYVLAPILLTLALFLLQMGVCTLTQVKRRFHALTYFPSMLMLTVLTDIPVDFDEHHSLGACCSRYGVQACGWQDRWNLSSLCLIMKVGLQNSLGKTCCSFWL